MTGYVILHDTTGSFLVVPKGQSEKDPPHLMFVTGDGSHDDFARLVYSIITGKQPDASRDPPLSVRYPIGNDDEPDEERAVIIEAVSRRCTIPLSTEYTWTEINDMLMKNMEGRYSSLIVQAIRNIGGETLDNPLNETVPVFARRGYGKVVRGKIRSRLKQCGYKNIESIDHRYSDGNSMLFRIDADETYIYYKMSASGCPEAQFTEALARLLPDYVVEPFGVDTTDNSFFTMSFGATLAAVIGDFDDEFIRKYLMKPSIDVIAEFHEKASKHVEELKRLGMEDTSPQRMRVDLQEFICNLEEKGILDKKDAENIRDSTPLIISFLDDLANGKIPLTVCHGDLHFSNLTAPVETGDPPLLFDWYESSISHPFLDFRSHLFGKDQWLDVYAEKWLSYNSSDKIGEMLGAAQLLRPLWDTFRLMKIMEKRGHQLDENLDWDHCRACMRRFSDYI